MLIDKATQPEIIKQVEGRIFEILVNNDEVTGIKAKHQVIDTSRQKDKTRIRYIAKTNEPQASATLVTATLEDAYLFLTQNA